MAATGEQVERFGRALRLSNQDKVLYPATGTTKGDVVEYYTAVAETIVPHLEGRPTTLKRYPDGVEGPSFFEKMCPKHRPEWLPVVPTWAHNSKRQVDYCRLDEPAAVVWTANLAALELHPGLARHDDLDRPTHLVFDLDPGPPAGLLECVEVAKLVGDALGRYGLECWPKVSGSKGIQVCAPLNTRVSFEATHRFANSLATMLEEAHPDLVVSSMKKQLRPGKVLIDWSQNSPTKTTISVWSLRARERPWVSVPVGWDELDGAQRAGRADRLRFEWRQALRRLERDGDSLRPVLDRRQELPDAV